MRPVDTIVVGAGWSGLAAAVELAAAGREVTVLEAAQQPGGRARSVALGDHVLDNGQHVLLGAYEHILALLHRLEVAESEVLLRLPLDLTMRAPERRGLALSPLYLPAPLHLLAGLLTARGAGLFETLRALPGIRRMIRETDTEDITVATLLQRCNQPESLRRGLWSPLCLAALNTPVHEASARLFTEVLKEAFTGHRSHCDLLLPRVDLDRVLAQPAQRYLEDRGGRLLTGRRVTGVEPLEWGLRVRMRDLDLEAGNVILATPPNVSAALLTPLPDMRGVVRGLEQLGQEPICTIYLQYPPEVHLPMPMVGVLDLTAQWVFDRRHTGQAGVMAVVVSGPGAHMDLDNDALARQVTAELALLFPDWPAPQAHWVVREKRATFRAAAGCEALRPAMRTPIRGLWLAGDHVRNGLPATLEGAVLNGIQCARAIIRETAPDA
ncbi:amine oxidase [Thioalkalivibrio denitrificans]|uniref:Amine oxidase n=1 Tax=Thioalkalivibrio denitrificans TaxID=108003 RepID=A0A1V3NCI1_9GAMM|nr:hydroxysqualene dehydroxylase HpnE [Thioalkalivibrio denitrificans]OOG22809.1 amine oxidase [Thioalkalivibrio denitrificans]